MDSFPLHSSKVNSFCSEPKITSPMAQIYVVSSKTGGRNLPAKKLPLAFTVWELKPKGNHSTCKQLYFSYWHENDFVSHRYVILYCPQAVQHTKQWQSTVLLICNSKISKTREHALAVNTHRNAWGITIIMMITIDLFLTF